MYVIFRYVLFYYKSIKRYCLCQYGVNKYLIVTIENLFPSRSNFSYFLHPGAARNNLRAIAYWRGRRRLVAVLGLVVIGVRRCSVEGVTLKLKRFLCKVVKVNWRACVSGLSNSKEGELPRKKKR